MFYKTKEPDFQRSRPDVRFWYTNLSEPDVT